MPIAHLRTAGVALLALAMTACASAPFTGPAEVTRFSSAALAEAPRGAIAVIPAPGADADGNVALAPYAEAVAERLAAIGYEPVDAGARQVAEVRVERSEPTLEARRGPASVGVGGSSGRYGSGVGVGIGINLGGGPRELVNTVLAVVIRDVDTREVLWEGRANFDATTNAEEFAAPVAARKLANALFADFPGNSGETIEVE